MSYNKNIILGIILAILTVFTIYSCYMAFSIRRREPERAKLVMERVHKESDLNERASYTVI